VLYSGAPARPIQPSPIRRFMISHRHWMALGLAVGWLNGFAVAQEPATNPSNTGGTSSFESSTTSETSSSTTGESTGTSTTPRESGGGASSTFGTPSGGAPSGEAPGPSSAFGAEGGGAPKEAPPSYTVPGFYGSPGTTLTGGEGRLARPHFRFSVNAAQGYDDNIFQSPSDPVVIPDQVVVIDPGIPDTIVYVPVTKTVYRLVIGPPRYYKPITKIVLQPVTIPGRDPVTQTIKFPQYPPRHGSLVTRAGISADMQYFTRRSLFTADLQGSIDYYWDRPPPGDSEDFSGSFSLAYLYNFTPRLQASATANVAYISQPDFSRINTPDRLGAGDIVNALGRLNVAYRASPRLTVTGSASQNAVIFTQKPSNPLDLAGSSAANGDNFETTFGVEGRYLWNPRFSFLAEYRKSFITYTDASSLDATTDYILIGGEFRLTSRLSATVRLGESFRSFDESGIGSSSFYGESTVAYRLGPTSALQWNSRYGFEPPPTPTSEVLSYRTTLTYLRSFTPRLSLNASVAGVYSTLTERAINADRNEANLSFSLSMDYRMTRDLTLNANYSFYKTLSSDRNLDYDRNRIFVGGIYSF
jgi:hypothetical protein